MLKTPTTLDETVEYFIPSFEGMESIPQAKDEDTFALYCHSQLSGGIGMQIRNHLNLWDEESDLHKYFKSEHNCEHPDEMSDLVIRNIHRKIKL